MFSLIDPSALPQCTGQYGCCTKERPCEVGGGDCYKDETCAGDLVCGEKNCQDFHPLADSYDDCCIGESVLKMKQD